MLSFFSSGAPTQLVFFFLVFIVFCFSCFVSLFLTIVLGGYYPPPPPAPGIVFLVVFLVGCLSILFLCVCLYIYIYIYLCLWVFFVIIPFSFISEKWRGKLSLKEKEARGVEKKHGDEENLEKRGKNGE